MCRRPCSTLLHWYTAERGQLNELLRVGLHNIKHLRMGVTSSDIAFSVLDSMQSCVAMRSVWDPGAVCSLILDGNTHVKWAGIEAITHVYQLVSPPQLLATTCAPRTVWPFALIMYQLNPMSSLLDDGAKASRRGWVQGRACWVLVLSSKHAIEVCRTMLW